VQARAAPSGAGQVWARSGPRGLRPVSSAGGTTWRSLVGVWEAQVPSLSAARLEAQPRKSGGHRVLGAACGWHRGAVSIWPSSIVVLRMPGWRP
jgi:hypothetical protein